jgi:hypothetical protein
VTPVQSHCSGLEAIQKTSWDSDYGPITIPDVVSSRRVWRFLKIVESFLLKLALCGLWHFLVDVAWHRATRRRWETNLENSICVFCCNMKMQCRAHLWEITFLGWLCHLKCTKLEHWNIQCVSVFLCITYLSQFQMWIFQFALNTIFSSGFWYRVTGIYHDVVIYMSYIPCIMISIWLDIPGICHVYTWYIHHSLYFSAYTWYIICSIYLYIRGIYLYILSCFCSLFRSKGPRLPWHATHGPTWHLAQQVSWQWLSCSVQHEAVLARLGLLAERLLRMLHVIIACTSKS